MSRIIIDAMGGDNAPRAQVEGALMAYKEFGCELLFVGDRSRILPILKEQGFGEDTFEIEHTDVVLHTEEDPFLVVKGKKNSSMGRALELLKQGRGDALVSSGNTGALLTGAQLVTKRIRGVRRAALAPIIPTKKGGALLIDCGATAEGNAEYLEQFALMGSVYLSYSLGRKNPVVGLLNNGAEETKGDELRKEVYQILKKDHAEGIINFGGNCEAREVTEGEFDVIVTDGFTGNIMMKGMEGMGLYISGLMKEMFYKNLFTKIIGLLLKPQINQLKAKIDYKEVGGAPLIGVQSAIIKAHGSANAYAFRSAIRQAMEYYQSGVIEELTKRLGKEKGSGENV
ncbi:MAG: phosphate acyltransferase PlsX [Clostridia bacterium]|nr:phosphate acyltransferase PlsX [Clostridia bacterium]